MREVGDQWTREEAAALRRLARLGISKTEAARRLGRHPSTISVRAKQAGLNWKLPPPKPKKEEPRPLGSATRAWTEDDDQRLARLAAEGVPVGLAANEVNRRYNTVLKHAKRLGLRFERDRQARLRHKGHAGLI